MSLCVLMERHCTNRIADCQRPMHSDKLYILSMDTPANRLKAIRQQRGFKSARDAARAYGWELSTYASHENGNRGIPPDAGIRYAQAFRFSIDWLYKGHSTEKSVGISPVPDIAFKVVPRLSSLFIKRCKDVNEAMAQATEFSSMPQTLAVPMPAFSMVITGNSMENVGSSDSFRDGDEAIFSVSAPIRPGDFVLAEIYGEDLLVFRQYMERGRTSSGFTSYDLAPLNPAHQTYHVRSADEARIVAKLVHVIKSYL